MDDYDAALHDALAELSQEVVHNGDSLKSQVEKRMRQRIRRTQAWFALGGVAAATVVGFSIHVHSEGEPTGAAALPAGVPKILQPANHRVATNGEFIPLPVKPDEPCPYAEKVSLSDLIGRLSVPVWMPSAEDASLQTLAGAWICGSDVTLTFTSGVNVTYEAGWSQVADVQKHWTELVATRGAGEVGTVLGQPALLGPAGDEYPPGEVFVVVDGDTLMWVTGDGKIPEEQLVEVANSIDLSNPLHAK